MTAAKFIVKRRDDMTSDGDEVRCNFCRNCESLFDPEDPTDVDDCTAPDHVEVREGQEAALYAVAYSETGEALDYRPVRGRYARTSPEWRPYSSALSRQADPQSLRAESQSLERVCGGRCRVRLESRRPDKRAVIISF